MLFFQHRRCERKFHKYLLLKNCTGTIYLVATFHKLLPKNHLSMDTTESKFSWLPKISVGKGVM